MVEDAYHSVLRLGESSSHAFGLAQKAYSRTEWHSIASDRNSVVTTSGAKATYTPMQMGSHEPSYHKSEQQGIIERSLRL